jgi:uncharacterized protein YgiM (DUF1202 family)
MKKKFGLLLAGMLATSVIAQTGATTPPPLPAPPVPEAPAPPAPPAVPAPPAPLPPSDSSVLPPATTNKPAKKAVKKTEKAPKKASTDKKHLAAPKAEVKKTEAKEVAPLALNQPAVVAQKNVVVRGKASINSEIVARLKQGDIVTVLEEVTNKPKPDEPSRWAKIAMPAGGHVWVNSSFVENNAVKSAKLNVRTGAGENYSVVGLLHKGDAIKSLGTKGDWTEIEAPAGAFAFVAAHLLAPAPAQPVQVAAVTPPPAPTPVPVPPTPATVEANPPVAQPPTDAPALPTPPPAPAPADLPVVSAPNAAPLLPPVEEPPIKRTVDREGIVSGTVSIQAPSYYQLKSLDNGNVIDYLHSDSTKLMLKQYKGKKVLVSGEEGLDERWPNTPVLTIQKIQIVE